MIPATGDYALRIAVWLASQGPGAHTSRDIAAATGVPSGYLLRVMSGLARAGIVASQRGLYGGFRLAREPERITARQIVDAVRPGPRRGQREEGMGATRAVGRLLTAIEGDAASRLERTTLRMLVDDAAGPRAGWD